MFWRENGIKIDTMISSFFINFLYTNLNLLSVETRLSGVIVILFNFVCFFLLWDLWDEDLYSFFGFIVYFYEMGRVEIIGYKLILEFIARMYYNFCLSFWKYYYSFEIYFLLCSLHKTLHSNCFFFWKLVVLLYPVIHRILINGTKKYTVRLRRGIQTSTDCSTETKFSTNSAPEIPFGLFKIYIFSKLSS